MLKGKQTRLREALAENWPSLMVQSLQENDDSLIRSWNEGILISTADPATMTCEMPGGKFDVQVDCDQIQLAVEVIGGLIHPDLKQDDHSSGK